MINRRIGSFIAALRKEQELTQEQFAEKEGSAWDTLAVIYPHPAAI